MMILDRNYVDCLDELRRELMFELDSITPEGEELNIDDENFQFELENGRYLIRINTKGLVDNEGYLYDYSALNIEELFELGDYLVKKYRNSE